ncbi:hypothetical protein CEW87_15765 [Parazoarcus communis]|uniref:Uncharacterized protein n=1 Tax=Parazoarcus communis TaxID=41977 RepID=A0A2U8H417_9RHOO|nr:hypothetical protein [Parazoarcus communis]AWI80697.1 hypothetical protein CEW87_15765 [Parazoarcus communis]
MSGYLLQLARRGLGLSPGVRSRATLPYAASTAAPNAAKDGTGLEIAPDVLQAASSSSPGTPDISPQSAPQTRNAATASTPSVPPTLLSAQQVQSGVLQRTAQAKPDTPGPGRHTGTHAPDVLQHRSGDTRETHAAHDTTHGTSIAANLAPTRSPATRVPHPDTRQTPPPTQAATRVRLDTLIDRLVAPPPQSDVPARDAATTASDERAQPLPIAERATLMPSRASTGAERMAVNPQPLHAGQTSDTPDTPPEVHITIGRLEINPPPRPAPPPPPQRRGPAPLSLGDYLARRQGGRS